MPTKSTDDHQKSVPDLERAAIELRREINFLENKVLDLTAQLEHARRLLESLTNYISVRDTNEPERDSRPYTHTLPSPKESGKPRNSGEFVAYLSREIIRKAGKPLDRREILTAIQGAGHTLLVADPPKFIGKTLWGHPDFIHIPGAGYWLAGELLASGKSAQPGSESE